MIVDPLPKENISEGGVLNRWWLTWFSQARDVLFAITLSGTTANRPTKLLWIGRVYFDTTLGLPIWLQSVSPSVWIKADGTVV